MPDPDLFARDPVYGLPKTAGRCELRLVQPAAIATLAPFRGQGMAVADVLKSLWKTGLPKTGKTRTSKAATLFWSAPGQWLVTGDFDPATLAQTLDGIAAVTDQSDAWAVLHLNGADATNILHRLTSLDINALATGDIARTEVARLAGILRPLETGFEIWLPRSAARWGVEKITDAMQRVAAQRALG